MSLRLSKKNIIKSKQLFQLAYTKGKNLSSFQKSGLHLRFFFFDSAIAEWQLKVAFIASKRNFRKAHDRNRIKRLLREAYRLNLDKLVSANFPAEKVLCIFWAFRGKPNVSFHEINEAMQGLISRILVEIESLENNKKNANDKNKENS